ncbi:uncharacterized protein LOC142540019 isoform X1 [Primulina tabacum]|uniref:uncharacterized protein LOC142540019 isoform X1 n=2 Tax=Primulina tabacum TaxID=48773 RepID=UPI003F5A91D0
MSSTTTIHGPSFPPLLQPTGLPMVVSARMMKGNIFAKTHLLRLCTANTSNNIHNSADFDKTAEEEGSSGKDRDSEATLANQILTRLKRYGISGVLSYGLLNTAYYLPTFLVVWFYVTPAPGRMGYLAAVERFLKVMGMVWAGSQVTKLVRAGGALALAPIVDKGLSWFTVKFKLESQTKAFMVITGFCFGLAFLTFLIVTILCA